MDVDMIKTSSSRDTMMTAMMMNMGESHHFYNPAHPPHIHFATTAAELNPVAAADHPIWVQELMSPPNSKLKYPFLLHPNSNNNNGNAALMSMMDRKNSMAAMREMIFRMAAMQPINIDPESVKPPKRRNVRISKDPQSVAARHRRERISERIRILQRMVPGGTKMDTASMLDEAIHYVKFLKKQVQSLEQAGAANSSRVVGHGIGFSCAAPPVGENLGYASMAKGL